MTSPRRAWLRWFVLSALVFAGCGGRQGPADHAEHDDHLEHHRPAHKPADLSLGVAEIERRWRELHAQWSTLDERQAASALNELREIVRWLPELAAETDLPEEPWNRIQELAAALHNQLPSVAPAQPSARGKFPDPQRVASDLSALQALAQRALALSQETSRD